MKQLAIISIFFVLLGGCTKFGKNMTVKGRVLNPVTGEGISNVPVIMYRSTLDYPSGRKKVKETTTDSEGYFEISKASVSKCYLTCDVTKVGDYYPIGWEKKDNVPLYDAFTISIKKGKTMQANYYAIPYGNMKYTIKNTSCFDQYDTLVVNRKYRFSDDILYNNRSVYTGCFEYIGGIYSKYPMGWHSFYGYFRKNNVITTFNDSIYIGNGTYHEWIFEY